MNGHVLTIHGVGQSSPGETLDLLSRRLAEGGEYERGQLKLEDAEYVRYSSPAAPELIEVNWADIRRPGGGFLGPLLSLPPLFVSLLYVADYGPQGKTLGSAPLTLGRGGKLCARVFRWWMESMAVWTLLLAVYARLLFLSGDSVWTRGLIVAGGVTLVAGLFFLVRRWSRNLTWAAGVWLAIFAAVGALFLFNGRVWEWPLMRWAAVTYAGSQMMAGLLGGLAAGAILFTAEGGTGRQRRTRAACVYLPLAALSILGTLLWWAVTNNFVTRLLPAADDYAQVWSRDTLAGFRLAGFHARSAELAVSIGVFGLGTLALLAAGFYGLLRLFRSRRAGAVGPAAFGLILWVGPVLFAGVLAALGFDALRGWLGPDDGRLSLDFVLAFFESRVEAPALWEFAREVVRPTDRDLEEFYRRSTLRALPYLLLLLLPVRYAVDALTDIVSYITPTYDTRARHKLSGREETLARFRAALEHTLLRVTSGDTPVAIVAHSQGSVVALEALAALEEPLRGRNVTLITLGSPITTYYQRFLGWGFSTDCHSGWRNYWRHADYIGGPVELSGAAVDNLIPQPGGHVGYWSDPHLAVLVRAALQAG